MNLDFDLFSEVVDGGPHLELVVLPKLNDDEVGDVGQPGGHAIFDDRFGKAKLRFELGVENGARVVHCHCELLFWPLQHNLVILLQIYEV